MQVVDSDVAGDKERAKRNCSRRVVCEPSTFNGELTGTNAKFRPIWESRCVCHKTARDLSWVGLAALEAEAFLVWPRLPGSRSRS